MTDEEIRDLREQINQLHDADKKELQERVRDLETWQARVETQMTNVEACLKRLERGNSTINTDLDTLKKLQYKLMGGIILVGAIWPAVPFFF